MNCAVSNYGLPFYLMVPMRLFFKAIMVKMTPVSEICMVLPIEPGVIVFVISTVVIVAAPCRIAIIGISRIGGFVDTDLHMNLCAGRIDRQRSSDDHG
jgi:hypothetical protein